MIWIRLRSPQINTHHDYYRVAGVDLASDMPLAPLAAYRRAEPAVPIPPLAVRQFDPARITRLYEGQHWLAGKRFGLSCWFRHDALLLKLAGPCRLELAVDKHQIRLTAADTEDARIMSEAVLGPGLILALALRGIFCLHASAARIDGTLCAFIAESGQGKSTLVATDESRWRRISDDVLPIALGAYGIEARPRFPQLKLGGDQQYPAHEPEYLPLGRIFLLSPQSPDAGYSIEQLDPHAGALALVRHSVAAKLFPPLLLSQQLRFAAAVVGRIPIVRLSYPKSLARLSALRASIRDHAQTEAPVLTAGG